uniref:Uncharacterized protein n=1 Tax=Arundo donax TaxID=35708 RepID=A0A0A9CG79_ARUDO
MAQRINLKTGKKGFTCLLVALQQNKRICLEQIWSRRIIVDSYCFLRILQS